MDDVREITILICDDCLYLRGDTCNNPRCVFCRRDMEEVGEYLDTLMIAPLINGQRVLAHRVYSRGE